MEAIVGWIVALFAALFAGYFYARRKKDDDVDRDIPETRPVPLPPVDFKEEADDQAAADTLDELSLDPGDADYAADYIRRSREIKERAKRVSDELDAELRRMLE